MVKSKDQLMAQMEQKKVENYLKEYEEAYNTYIEPINRKYELRLIPTIVTNKVGGMNPAHGLEQYKVTEVTPQDPVPLDEKQLETETN
jgi:hypothetical protein